jgi:lauroyl/myristoyl acyltransferase
MDLRTIINHGYGIRTGLALARIMPKSAGYALARFLARGIAMQRNQPMVKAVRTNQWVARDGQVTSAELDEAVRQTFVDRAYSIFDLYHNLQKPERMSEYVEFSPEYKALIERSQRRDEGMVVVLPHVSNYELVGLASALQGGQAVTLTLPEQPGGYKQHDIIRQKFGIEAVPASMASFKHATRHLQEGGTVATGVDRPLPESRYRPRFFGREAALPVHYVVLALRTNVPVVVAWVSRGDEGLYRVVNSDFIPMQKHPNRKTEILLNAERILEVAERYIRQNPQQWAMFFEVWPDVAPETLD